MSEHYVIRGDRKHCLHCEASYNKNVSTNTLNAHFNKHKSQPTIAFSTINSKTKIANEQLSVNLAKAFSLLNWPLHHIKSEAFAEIVKCLRQSSAEMPARLTLRTKTLTLAKEYEDR